MYNTKIDSNHMCILKMKYMNTVTGRTSEHCVFRDKSHTLIAAATLHPQPIQNTTADVNINTKMYSKS
jgi:hypothetical protein